MLKVKTFLHAILAVFAVSLIARHASATPIEISFDFLQGSTAIASGSFQFDSSLDGTNIGYSDLDAFDITANGVSYDLSFVNSGGFSQFYQFNFDTTTNTFQWLDISGFDTLMAAIKSDFDTGFFIRPLESNPLVTEYSVPTFDVPYDNITISRSQVPSPATLTLLGFGLAGLGWSRRKKA